LGIKWWGTWDGRTDCSLDEVEDILVCLLESKIDGEGGESGELWMEFI
jgi:hypothetical protein